MNRRFEDVCVSADKNVDNVLCNTALSLKVQQYDVGVNDDEG